MDHRENSSMFEQTNFTNPFAPSQAPTPIAPSNSSHLFNCHSSNMSSSAAMTIREYPHEAETDASSDGYDSDATLDLAGGVSSPLAAAFLQDAPPLRRMSRDYERVVLRSLSYSQAGGVAYACACSRNVRQVCSRHVGKWAGEDDDEYDSEMDGEDEEYYLEESSDDEGSVDILHTGPKMASSDSQAAADTPARSMEMYENFVHLLLSDASAELAEIDVALDARRRMRSSSLTGCAEAPF